MKVTIIILSICLIQSIKLTEQKRINDIVCDNKEKCIDHVNKLFMENSLNEIKISFDVFNLTENFLQDLHPEKIVALLLFNVSIQNIEENSLKNCDLLLSLNLSYNNINDVQHIFTPKLEDLFLNGNNIIIRENSSLFNKELNTLKQLQLQHCNLSKIYAETFEHSKNLKILNLDHNNIEELNSESFSILIELIELGLKNNKLKQLPDTLLSTNQNIEEIRLSNNLLKTLPNELFCNLTKIKTVHLVNNSINYFNVTVSEFSDLTFYVFDQPIDCSHDKCNWSNDTEKCNKNNCRIYILNESCDDDINTNDVSEFRIYSWIFFGTVIIIQIAMLIVFIVIYFMDINKTKIK